MKIRSKPELKSPKKIVKEELKGSVLFYYDPTEPIDVKWEVN